MNTIDIDSPIITKNRIEYNYRINGNWKKLFKEEKFFVEYNYNIDNVPESIAIIPLICNILPISWLCDAKINIKDCDKNFFESIPEFKEGYVQMYPNLEFKGSIEASKLTKNKMKNPKGALAFFSGGVDAFNTLLNHIEEKPTMFTVWGADIKIKDEIGWKNVENHIKEVGNEFKLSYIIAKSNLRECFYENKLCELVKDSKDTWWHGFQHGIGLICLAAPITHIKEIKTIYFASSYTEKEKGKFTLASDITIDPYLRISDTNVVHDGYEFNRQDKVHNIVEYSRKNNKKVKLRVCWQENAGKNCCNCEKCWRTMLGLFAENADPKDYGFNYTSKQLKRIKNSDGFEHVEIWYEPIQKALKKNVKYEDLPNEIKWFYKIDINKLGHHPIYSNLKKIIRKVKRLIKRIQNEQQ